MVFRENKIKFIQIATGFIIIIIFCYLQFLLKWSIFFNYDMPRVALVIQNFLNNGTYMTSQYFYSEASWLNVAWGPAFVFFYGLLLKCSSDPMIVSYLLIILNIFGIVSILILCWKYFSPTVGLISSALLAFNPYWFTYTRIIYQPSPLTILLPITMFMFFEAINNKKYALFLLPNLFIILFQIYIPTYSFIFTCLVFSLLYIKKMKLRYFLVGSLFAFVFIIPSIKFYYEKPEYISRFFNAPSQFTPREKNLAERIKNVSLNYIELPVAGKFEWQTAYGYKDFVTKYVPNYEIYKNILVVIFTVSLLWNVFYVIKYKNIYRAIIFFWALAPYWSMVILKVTDYAPRYFLIGFPASMIIISLLISDLIFEFKHNKKIFYFSFVIPMFIVFNWIFVNIQYSRFIRDYSYPMGKFQDIAEVSYLYLKQSMDWVFADSQINNCTNLVLSNDVQNINFNLWMETEYMWKYFYNRKIDPNDTSGCVYLIVFDTQVVGVDYSKKFGPLVVYKIKNQPSQIY